MIFDDFNDDDFFNDNFPLEPSKMMKKMFQDLDSMGFGHMSPTFSPLKQNVQGPNKNKNKKNSKRQRKPKKNSPNKTNQNPNHYKGSIILTNYNDVSFLLNCNTIIHTLKSQFNSRLLMLVPF